MDPLARFTVLVLVGTPVVVLPAVTRADAAHALRPAASVTSHLSTESSQVLPKWTPSAGLSTAYLRNVGNAGPDTVAIDARVQSHLLLAFGIAGWAQLDAAIPMTISQRGTTYDAGEFVELPPAALGDVRLGAKGTILRTPRRGFGLGTMFDITLPTGQSSALTTYGGLSYTPALLAEYRFTRGIVLAGNLGYAARPEVNLASNIGGDAVTYRVAARVPVVPREQFAVFAELDGETSMVEGGPFPLAARGGLRWRTPGGVVLNLWGGAALVDVLGLPTAQAGISFGFAPARQLRSEPAFEGAARPRAVELARGYDRQLAPRGVQSAKAAQAGDPDGDGVFATADLCPNVPEDVDGMQDGDGCPDLDDDQDGLRDGVDLCPRAPEIVNGYRDADGCPDVRLPDGHGRSFETLEDGRLLPALRFAPGSSSLDAQTRAQLDALAELLRLNPWIEQLQLAVFVPRTQDPSRDQALARDRAAAVTQALTARGVDARRIQALPAKTVPAGVEPRIRLSLSRRSAALQPAAPRPEALDPPSSETARTVDAAARPDPGESPSSARSPTTARSAQEIE